jgi:ParB family transcriptional regulator, chromosome partitioning protein
VSKPGLPATVKMRHDLHYVEELSRGNRPIGKIIDIDRIQPNPDQPRTEIGDLSELSASIKEKGVLEPLLVLANGDGTYMIIAGERRWRASKLAGLTEVPCIQVDTDEKGVAEIALIENLQRKDLNIWEEADGLKALAEKFGYTQDQIARKISKSRTTVTELMTVAGLPQTIRDRCREKNINSKSTLLEIARQFDDDSMLKLVDSFGNGSPDHESVKKAARAERTAREATPATEKVNRSFRLPIADLKCVVEVKFQDPSSMNRNTLMKALKKSFDAVKNEETIIDKSAV